MVFYSYFPYFSKEIAIIQAFKEAEVPTTPFTFLLANLHRRIVFEDQIFTNNATNEEFSVRNKTRYNYMSKSRDHLLEIKRAIRT